MVAGKAPRPVAADDDQEVPVGRAGVRIVAATGAVLLASGVGGSGSAQGAGPVDLLIRGGQVYTGDLSAPSVADVGVKGDRIVFVGDAGKAGVTAAKTIEAKGRMVAPGFIDAHTHATGELASQDPKARLLLRQLTQGVTTSVIGVDGAGDPEIADYMAKANAAGVGNNFAAYVGFGAIRERVLQNDARAPTPAELEVMKGLAKKGMCEGALGLSSGLFYPPQSFAKTEEVIAVAKEAGSRGGLYDTHQRDEGTTSIGVAASTEEQIRIGRESGATLHLGHFKVSSGAKPDGQSMAALIKVVEAARAAGQKVTSDQYPWSASNTGLSALAIARWAQDGGRAAMLKRFDDPSDLAKIKAQALVFYKERGGAQNVLINGSASQPELVGKRISEIAEAWGVDEAEATIRILRKGSASVATFAITEPDIRLLMKQPWNMFSTDGSPSGHPRGHASYPRLYTKYVVEEKVITPVEFVHKSTGLVADTLGIEGRGYLKPGYFADIVVIDLANYQPKADYVRPTLLSTGVEVAVVNGKVELEGGVPSGILAGRGLPRKTPAGCP
ncbi:MAG: D-aminoacylase [Phenylobacterium sp.]|uniref:N-acyl-D-amino-acid deacylase family protein n=1 Tax=Phenylobacterium sp. TaxID=1871053 RepID=UPI0012154268|nr:amidohydrolase family protein [Phenylobacterium sp.]TAJ72817.1 MAG: D-aminoacylase [Phenylobacterium sp.]